VTGRLTPDPDRTAALSTLLRDATHDDPHLLAPAALGVLRAAITSMADTRTASSPLPAETRDRLVDQEIRTLLTIIAAYQQTSAAYQRHPIAEADYLV
jgi:hypothetical protein